MAAKTAPKTTTPATAEEKGFNWSEQRKAAFSALIALKATSAGSAASREAVGKKSKMEDAAVKHVLYKDEPLVKAGFVVIAVTDDGRGYYATAAGIKAFKSADAK